MELVNRIHPSSVSTLSSPKPEMSKTKSKQLSAENLLTLWKPYLTENGGIKEQKDVPTLVNVMKNFSLKLVSKTMYLNILLATKKDVLTNFVKEGGFDIIDSW